MWETLMISLPVAPYLEVITQNRVTTSCQPVSVATQLADIQGHSKRRERATGFLDIFNMLRYKRLLSG